MRRATDDNAYATALSEVYVASANSSTLVAGDTNRSSAASGDSANVDPDTDTATDVFDAAGFRRMEALGVTDAMVCPWYYRPGDTEALDHQVDAVHWFGDEVIAGFSG